MKNNNSSDLLANWISKFLTDEIMYGRNYSIHTQKSYRDTFALFLNFIKSTTTLNIDKLKINNLTDDVIRQFLAHLTEERKVSPSTLNQRLAVFKSFAKYLVLKRPDWGIFSTAILGMHRKRVYIPIMDYMTKDEMDILLSIPDCTTKLGYRDYLILLIMFNTGARVSEISNIKIIDIDVSVDAGTIFFHGKGKKERHCPLIKGTTNELRNYIKNEQTYLFYGARKNKISRFGIYDIIEKYVTEAKKICPTLQRKNITPHSIRHTTAMHLLESGNDIVTISRWLGHSSLETTMRYLALNGEMLRATIEKCAFTTDVKPVWKNEPAIIEFLKSL